MDAAKKYEQLKRLRALAENPSTPEEGENARVRIEEIEARIRREHEEDLENERREREARARKRTGKKLSIANLRARKRKGGDVARFETEWPFGWERRDAIQVSELSFPHEKKIVLEWKCPSCEMHVERTITPRHRARLMGKPEGVRDFIGDIRGGKLNQLCDECWKKHQ